LFSEIFFVFEGYFCHINLDCCLIWMTSLPINLDYRRITVSTIFNTLKQKTCGNLPQPYRQAYSLGNRHCVASAGTIHTLQPAASQHRR
jgi:hypothetical protein